MFEAQCLSCGETFNPIDENDLIHATNKVGRPCGGTGVLLGEYKYNPWAHPISGFFGEN